MSVTQQNLASLWLYVTVTATVAIIQQKSQSFASTNCFSGQTLNQEVRIGQVFFFFFIKHER